MPLREVTGLVIGDRILNFVKTVFFVDKSNQLMAELTFNKNVRIQTFLLQSLVSLNPKKQSRIGKIASVVTKFFKKEESKPTPTDFFQIVIYTYNKSEHKLDHKTEHMEVKKVQISEGRFLNFVFATLIKFVKFSGSWLEYIEFDGEMFWKIDEEVEPWETDVADTLPSHCLLREDYKNLKENNVQKADE